MSDTTPWDGNAEIRAMILSALPFPPLPVLSRGMSSDESVLGDEKVITTHDIISRLLEHAVNIQDPKVHDHRKKRERKVLANFMHELLEICKNREIQPPELYQLYCKYSIQHINAFFPNETPPPISILNFDIVQKGDQTHSRMSDYMAAQAVLFNIEPNTKKAWENTPYHQMLLEAKNRLVQDEPRELIQ